jgi:hypothetical protein
MPRTDVSFRRHCAGGVLAALTLIAAPLAGAVTPEELTGDYRLAAIDIDYGLVFPPSIDTNDFTRLDGYLAATGAIMVFDWFGIARGTEYEQQEEGRYTLSGSRLVLTDAEGLTTNLDVAMPNANTVVLTGVARDDFQNLDFEFRYQFAREATYFNQAQLDAAIADAIAGLFTQAELDAAVQEALDSVEPEVIRQPVVIPLLD